MNSKWRANREIFSRHITAHRFKRGSRKIDKLRLPVLPDEDNLIDSRGSSLELENQNDDLSLMLADISLIDRSQSEIVGIS